MAIGYRRTLVARIGAALGFVCGLIALLESLTGRSLPDQWVMLEPAGWVKGGMLLTLLALFVLVDGAIAFRKSQSI